MGNRVVVPQAGEFQYKVLNQLHQGHPGVSRMKGIAHSFVWWPGLDKVIEEKVKSCCHCQQHQKTPSLAPLHPWEWPERPWSRVHIDHAGPFHGKLFLVLVDAHSKWLEVVIVPSTTSQATIQKLREIFATHGLPEVLVSDNAAVFTSADFQAFMTRNGIRHITSAPYHPASNGLAERAVQTFKEALSKTKPTDIEAQLSRFLFHYRNTPHTTTGSSPAELLLGRCPRSHLTLLKPNISTHVRNNVQRQISGHDQHAKDRHFALEDPVFIRNFDKSGPAWLPGIICEVKGPLTYFVELADKRIFRRHIEHIRKRTSEEATTNLPEEDDDPLPTTAPTSTREDNDTSTPLAVEPAAEPRRLTRRIQNLPDRLM